ncbi:MAK10-like protein [Tanacetum coccineum]
MASQDTRLSKFESDFKQQQSEMTNKIDIVLKAITDRIAGALPSDTVKNPKLSASLVLSARSYLKIDPQCLSHPSTSINAIKAYSMESTISQASLLQTGMEIKPQQPEEPEPTLEYEFQDLHLNLPILKVLAHAPIYKAILDKYVKSLELGKNGSAFFQGKVPAKMEDPGLFTLPCRLGDSKPFDTLADLGSCVNIIPLYLFKKLNIGLLEETDHIFELADGTKSYPVGIVKCVEVHIGKLKLLNDLYVIDMKKDPETPLLVGRGFLATANAVIDCRMTKIVVGEGITRSVFGVKGVDLGEEEAPYWTTLGKRKSYKPRPSSDGIGARTPYYARKSCGSFRLTPSPSLYEPVMKQLAIKLGDEYGFVIRQSSVALTSGSVRTILQYKYCTCDQSPVTELVDFVEAHEHLHTILVYEQSGLLRVKKLVVEHELETLASQRGLGELTAEERIFLSLGGR